jgi:hypothetical protein
MLKESVKRSRVYAALCKARLYYWNRRAMRAWARAGRPVPPPHKFKQETVKSYARKFGLDVLVETGTFQGDMIEATRSHFREIYSVELGEELHRAACLKFARYKHVHLFRGDSAAVLRELLPKLNRPPLIWLDAHYSGGITVKGYSDTPVIGELHVVLDWEQMSPVILIDDARCFDGTNGYPTIEAVREMILYERPDWIFEVRDDIIRAHAPQAGPRDDP